MASNRGTIWELATSLSSTVLISPLKLANTTGTISMLMGIISGVIVPEGRDKLAKACEILSITSSILVPYSYWATTRDMLESDWDVISFVLVASAMTFSISTVTSSATCSGPAPGYTVTTVHSGISIFGISSVLRVTVPQIEAMVTRAATRNVIQRFFKAIFVKILTG
jgi:hypothetical protein